VEIVGLALTGQTFMLTFDVSNPNSFSLPISSVKYGVKLDDQPFASGSTSSKFSVPANGDAQFAISVDLNLLQSAPMLLALVRRSGNEEVPYELNGELDVDLPLVPTVPYSGRGSIRLGSLAR
ncbi:MAG: LEA type 2 family protein, partial [Woeseiaceae bacterium]|nr:LEA type 2 family protein [Woeseiaceae bacterium]